MRLVRNGHSAPLQLAEIVDVKLLQSLVDDFHSVAGIPMAIVDMRGNILAGIGWQDICTGFHRKHPETCKNCIESDTQLTAAIAPGEFKLYKCKNSMWDIATPLVVSGQHIGNIFSGQFFLDDEPVDEEAFRAQAERYGFDRDQYLAALAAVPRLSREHLQRCMRFLTRLAHLISQMSFSNVELARALAERKQTEDRITHLASFPEVNPAPILETDLSGNIRYANPAARNRFPTLEREAARHPVLWNWPAVIGSLIHPNKPTSGLSGTLPLVREIECDGAAFLQTVHYLPETGSVRAYFTDITERKSAELALQESEEQLECIYQNAPLLMLLVDRQRRIRRANRLSQEFSDLSEAEMIGLRGGEALRCLHARDDARGCGFGSHCDQCAIRLAIFDTFTTGRSHEQVEAHIERRVEGETQNATVLLSTAGVSVRGEPHVLVTMQDITDRKRAEEALLRSEKQASVGRMAATIAHEINNPLEVVTNSLFLANSSQELSSVREYLESADEELKRIARITRQSLGFYRESSAPVSTSIFAVLDSAISLLKRKAASKNVDILKKGVDCQVTAVPGELRQVFANLLSNSLDAVERGGLIKVRVSNCRKPGCEARVRITVADNGAGIGASSRRRVFEPFFTTKGAVGTGLGLWVSKQIVERHRGSIRVLSRTQGPQRGTSFSILMPVNAEAPGAPERSQA